MSNTDISANTENDKFSHLKPVTASGKPINWADSNDARLEGILFNIKKFWKRNHLFGEFFQHHAAPVGSKIAVDHPAAIPFITGVVKDVYDATDRCPPTDKRLAQLASHSPSAKYVATPGAALPTHIIVSQYHVDAEDGKLLKSLEYVVEGSIHASKMLDKAEGSGETLLTMLEDRAKKASPKAKAVVAAEFSKHVANGIVGELTHESLDAFLKKYEDLKVNIARTITDADEVEMVNAAAFKSAEVRDLYEIKAEIAAPNTLEDAVVVLQDILTGRKLSEDIDRIQSGATDEPTKATLVNERIAELEALVSELRKADPNNTTRSSTTA